jgi:hypothetical protein
MNLIIVAVIAVVLFGLAFISRRRFGIHGLALAAGAFLSQLWGNDLGVILSGFNLLPDGFSAVAVSVCIITVLPALLLMFRGKKAKKVITRVFSGLIFAVLALAFIVEPLSSVLPLDATGVVIYTILLQYKGLIIGSGIIIAILDILLATTPKPAPEEKHRH